MEETDGWEPSDPQIDDSLDFDGDGQNDAAVAFSPTCGSGGCEWWLFVHEGKCARFAGKVFGRKLLPLGREAGGALVLRVDAHAGTFYWREQHARRDATGKYTVFEERTCEVPWQPKTVCTPWAAPSTTQRP